MKNLFFIIAFLFTTAFTFAQDVYVQGYTRSNGTYVQGYYRTSPNSTRNDNYSTVGNVNPYTGAEGTKPADNYYSTSTYSAPVQTYSTITTSPTYYSTPSYSTNNTIYTGSRGGQYYINSNGNKSYVRRR